MTEATLEGWKAGEPCERHFLAFCADCMKFAKLTHFGGEIVYQKGCGINTLREVTGLDYEFAAEVLREAGASLGDGTTTLELRTAIESLGGILTEVTGLGERGAEIASWQSGRRFIVTAWKRSGRGYSGHAWSITEGQPHRAWPAPYRYRIYEVTGL